LIKLQSFSVKLLKFNCHIYILFYFERWI
jgi:hypothetical protein